MESRKRTYHHHRHVSADVARVAAIVSAAVLSSFFFTQAEAFSFAIPLSPSSTLVSPAFYRPMTTSHEHRKEQASRPLYSSYISDSSDYSSYGSGNSYNYVYDDYRSLREAFQGRNYDKREVVETVELSPVGMSKNSGSRFVSIVWDRVLDRENRDAVQLHEDRVELTEDHVMYCRKANLYNETFNTESMVDVLWSLPILSSDLIRVIGHAMCMESTALHHVHDFMKKEPIIQMLTGGDLTNISLFRWRHIRDHTLRMDDGRFGYPCLCLGMDYAADINASDNDNNDGNLRADLYHQQLEYLIRSKKVIATGPLHLPTEFKDDPKSLAVGDLVLFNAKNRDDAIRFAEDMPYAAEGLYGDLRVHFYNTLDLTGKFVSEDPLCDSSCADMKEAMEVWGYPVHDHQTPWLNW